MEYTEAIHAQRLITILEMDNTCNHCPICLDDRFSNCGTHRERSAAPGTIGYICRNFVDANYPDEYPCPCDILGAEEALKRSWIALEAKGYI